MSFANSDMVRTLRGIQLAADAQAGTTRIVYTRFALGSGYAASQSAIASMTHLVSERLSAQTMSIRATGEQVIIRAHYSNIDVREAFNWREFGIYAKGDDGEEILFCYTCDRASTDVIENNPTIPSYDYNWCVTIIRCEADLDLLGIGVRFVGQEHDNLAGWGDGISGAKLDARDDDGVAGEDGLGVICHSRCPPCA